MNQVVARIAMPVLGIIGVLCGALAAVAFVVWILDQGPGASTSHELVATLALGLAAAGCFLLRRLLDIASRRTSATRPEAHQPH